MKPSLVVLQLYIARALAQCSTSGTTTISQSNDASALSSACSTFSGSIAIATGATDKIALDGIQLITGDLTAANGSIPSLSADSLVEISGIFTLQDLTKLATLFFPQISRAGQVSWNGLPALEQLDFGTGITKAQNVLIQNTQLRSIQGVDRIQAIGSYIVIDNPYLESFELLLKNFTNSVTISGNGQNLGVNFPFLESTFNMTIQNASSVNLPSLTYVNGSTGFYDNTFTNFSAPLLKTLGGTLSLVGNPELQNISVPSLKTVGGGLQVANNSNVKSLNFDSVEVIAGAMLLQGSFTELSLKNLRDIRGSFKAQSSENISQACGTVESLGANSVIKGTFVCEGDVRSVANTTTTTSSTGSGSSATGSGTGSGTPYPNSGLSTGAKAGIGVGVSLGALALLAIAGFLLYRRRQRKNVQDEPAETSEMPIQELEDTRKAELHGDAPGELATGKEAQELHAPHGTTEMQIEPSELAAERFDR